MMKTLIIVILDESGSMARKKSEVIGGFNNFIDQQKEISTDEARLTLIKFNSRVFPVWRNIRLEETPKLDSVKYEPCGFTALFDAIAKGIQIGEGDQLKDERVVMLIMTDGIENSSTKTNRQQLKEMIKKKEETEEWTFVYIGENPVQFAEDSGIDIGSTVEYDRTDSSQNFSRANEALSGYRCQSDKRCNNLFMKK